MMGATMTPPQARTRRWPIAAVAVGLAAVVVVAVAGGSARATADAAGTAADLAEHGQYGLSIAVDNAIAKRTGPLYQLDHADVANAKVSAQRTVLAWARALGRSGQVDQAVALARTVTDPRLSGTARDEQAALLLAAAQADAAHGDYPSALARLDQVASLNTAAGANQVVPLRAQYLVALGQTLVAAGKGAEALTALDAATRISPAAAGSAANVMPSALLAAARQQIEQQAYADAAADLQRLVTTYSGATEARIARGLLSAGQPVTGTLVDRAGLPLNAEVRLSSHFFSQPGGYLTSGPFFTTLADSDGNFRFDSIPPGGPYVFEIFHNGNWMTFVDPNTGQPANPVNVAPVTPAILAFITIA